MQRVTARIDGAISFLELPGPASGVVDGVHWGRYDQPLTAAYWAAATWMEGSLATGSHRLGETLSEEVIACILGGFGNPAEIGLAAFDRVRMSLRESSGTVADSIIERLLLEPLRVGGRTVRYRFARRRAAYIASALSIVEDIDEDSLSDRELRRTLLGIRGVGPKTASWIVRNRRSSDDVAILDVHVVRACRILGLFTGASDQVREYDRMEERFLNFCRATNSRASSLDAIMWRTMRSLDGRMLRFLAGYSTSCSEHLDGVKLPASAPSVIPAVRTGCGL